MPWIDIVTWASFAIAVVALAGTVYGICDVRRQVREMLELQRNLLYTEALNESLYDFVDPSAGSLKWAHMHKFAIVQRALEPKRTLDGAQLAATYEALWIANELTKNGMTSWKAEVDANKVQDELGKWATEKNEARMRLIFGNQMKTLF